MTILRTSVIFSAWMWLSVILVAVTIETTDAWTTTPLLLHARTRQQQQQQQQHQPPARATTTTSTPLFGKKKKKGGDGATKGAAAKIQVKLLQHIAGTGQAGDVILVNPVFFDNKLRPQKLARVITDEEVKANLEEKQSQSDELLAQAQAVRDLLDDSDEESSYVLTFHDNQTGPDGKKLFGGIGPKKLTESLRKDCKEFDAYSKQFTKQVSILDVEEQELEVADDDESSSDGGSDSKKYKDYSSYSVDNSDEPKAIVSYVSLPKTDKLTIKHTGVFRMKVALTKDLFVKVKIVVD